MSEYQYYEFQAIDRPLDQRAMAALRAITSRAEITPTSLINVYHYGDFRGDPDKLMEEYFDAFLYVANWGTHRLMLRLPTDCFDLDAAEPYTVPYIFEARRTKEHVIVHFHSEEEGGDWEEGEGWLASLIPLRADLMAGDLRALYLAWLSAVEVGEVDEEALEPPLPSGLRHLSAPLTRLADFLRVDPNLIEAAAGLSTGEAPAGPSPEELATWVAELDGAEKDRILVQIMQGKAPNLGAELLHRFRRSWALSRAGPGQQGAAEPARRKAGDLRKAADELAEEKRRRAALRAATEQERRAREQAAARARHLDALAGREDELWQQVEAAILTKQAKEYQRAVTLLQDLRDLGKRSGASREVEDRIRQLRERHRGKWALMKRLDKAGLPK